MLGMGGPEDGVLIGVDSSGGWSSTASIPFAVYQGPVVACGVE